jgi:hypothetical protein
MSSTCCACASSSRNRQKRKENTDTNRKARRKEGRRGGRKEEKRKDIEIKKIRRSAFDNSNFHQDRLPKALLFTFAYLLHLSAFFLAFLSSCLSVRIRISC